jgi:GTP:adenosylcobinamide-phosphate guanylyltransferase
MEAIVLAGGVTTPGDPIYEYSGNRLKALLPIAHKPMVQWVLDALNEAETIAGIHLVGINQPSSLMSHKPITFTEDSGGLLKNIRAGFDQVHALNPTATHVVITSSDIPMINGDIVDWRVNSAMAEIMDYDFAVVERTVMEKRFPRSNRSYIKLAGTEICAADINVFRIQAIENEDFWQRIISLRKRPLAQARFIGLNVLIRMLFRRLSLSFAEQLVSERFGLQGIVRFSPYAEIAMDIDKPHQYEMVQREFQLRRDTGVENSNPA